MKKKLLKLTLVVAVLFSAIKVQAQALYTVPGKYKISTSGLSPNLYMGINGATGALEWQAENTDDTQETQLWSIQDHGLPASAGYVQITSKAFGTDWTMIVDQTTFTGTGDKEITIGIRPGTPIIDAADANYGFDQFQRRKAKVGADGLADSAGSNPPDGNNALFAKPTGEGGSRYGVVPSAEGDAVEFDGLGIDVIQFHLVEAAVASVNTFGVEAFSISNPINNTLNIKGATSKVSKVNVYSVLGNTVLSKSLNNINGDISLNTSSLSKGLYIIEMTGNNGERFTKKIIKQ